MSSSVEMSRPARIAPGRVTQLGVIESEWIKFRSLRSSWYSLLATIVIVDGLGTLISSLRAHREHAIGRGGVPIRIDTIEASLRGVFLAQLAIGVLGALIITGEYSTGQIRSSLGAVPRRV